jgi:hypothetical protein
MMITPIDVSVHVFCRAEGIRFFLLPLPDSHQGTRYIAGHALQDSTRFQSSSPVLPLDRKGPGQGAIYVHMQVLRGPDLQLACLVYRGCSTDLQACEAHHLAPQAFLPLSCYLSIHSVLLVFPENLTGDFLDCKRSSAMKDSVLLMTLALAVSAVVGAAICILFYLIP